MIGVAAEKTNLGGALTPRTRRLQEELPESHYGLVLALQVHVPDMAIDLVQVAGSDYGPPDYPDLPSGLFCIIFSDLQATLAIDEDVRDMR